MRFKKTSHRNDDKQYIEYLKTQVNVVDLFEYLHLFDDGKLQVKPNRIVGVCPMPDHPNADNPTAFNFDTEKKLFYCHTKCGRGGDVITFLERYLNIPFPQAVLFLEDFLGIKSDKDRSEWKTKIKNQERSTKRTSQLISPPEQLPEYRFVDHYERVPEWAQTILGEDVVEYFDIRYTAKGYYKHRLLWPIHDHEGRPVGMTGRTVMPVTKTNPKWLHTPSLKKQHVLFNLNRALDYISQDDNTVYLVEGPKDVAALWRFGQPNVVALLGYTISAQQLWLLHHFSRRVIILLDNQPSAVIAAAKIAYRIRQIKRLDCFVMPLPEGKDPWDVDQEVFYEYKSKAVPASYFLKFFDDNELDRQG